MTPRSGGSAVTCACFFAFAVSAAAPGTAWSLEGEALDRRDRWHPGEGLRDGDWYTYVICGAGLADGACHVSRLEFAALDDLWSVRVTAVDLAGREEGPGRDAGAYGLRGATFEMIVEQDTLNMRYADAPHSPYAHSISSTVFFLGGTVRLGDAHGNDPILETGSVWARLHEPRSSHPWYERGSDARGSVVVTGTVGGHDLCGSRVNSTAYRATYLDEAVAYADIVDGLPFPVHGAAAGRNPDLTQIHGDRLITGPHWYKLVEHSGMRADPLAGGACSAAAAMADPAGARQAAAEVERAAAYLREDARPPAGPAVPANSSVSVSAESSGHDVTIRGNVSGGPAQYVVLGAYDEGRSLVHRAYAVPDRNGGYRSSVDAGAWGEGTYVVTATYGNAAAASAVRLGGASAFGAVPVLGSGMSVECAVAGGAVLFAHMREGALVLSLRAVDDGLLLLRMPQGVAPLPGGPPYQTYVDGRPAADYAARPDDQRVTVSVAFPAGARQVWVYGGQPSH